MIRSRPGGLKIGSQSSNCFDGQVLPVASEFFRDALGGYEGNLIIVVRIQQSVQREDALYPISGWIFELSVDGQSPETLQVASHLREWVRRKRPLKILLDHCPDLGARQIDD